MGASFILAVMRKTLGRRERSVSSGICRTALAGHQELRGPGRGQAQHWSARRRHLSPRGAERRQRHLHRGPQGRLLLSGRSPAQLFRIWLTEQRGLEFQLCIRAGPRMWDAPLKGPLTQRSQSRAWARSLSLHAPPTAPTW